MRKIISVFMVIVLLFLMAGCIKESDEYLYESKDKDWSIMLPKEYIIDKEDSIEEYKSFTTYFKTKEGPSLAINEIIDENIEVNEEELKKEIALDNYYQVDTYETLSIQDFGVAYGAMLFDTVSASTIMYYRLKHEDKVVSFIFTWENECSIEQEAEAKTVISTFKSMS